MFCIDQDNCIIFSNACDGDHFSSLESLTSIATERGWNKVTVTEVWNGFAGTPGFDDVKPQKCFKNLGYGLGRLWWAIQRLAPKDEVDSTAVEEPVDTGTEDLSLEDSAIVISQQEESPADTPVVVAEAPKKTRKRAMKEEKPVKEKKAKAAKKAATVKVAKSRSGTKREEIIRLMSRVKGASADDLMQYAGWQPHSLRGFISTLGSKHGIAILSEKDEKRGRVYRIAA